MRKKLYLFLFSFISIISLASAIYWLEFAQPAEVTIQIPWLYGMTSETSQIMAQGEVIDSATESVWNYSLDPQKLSDINCVVVLVGGADEELNSQKCYSDALGSNEVASFGRWIGGFSKENKIRFTVEPGFRRRIYLVGTRALPGACHDFGATPPTAGTLAPPKILGSVIADLRSGKNNQLEIEMKLDNSPRINHCLVKGEKLSPSATASLGAFE